MRTLLLVVGALLLLLLAGCGGGTPSSLTSRATGRATVTVLWPVQGRSSSLAPQTRLIPLSAGSIVVQVQNGTSVIATQTLTRPASGSTTTAVFNVLPPGNLTATAIAYPTSNGTGTPQALASTPLVIAASQNTAFSLSLASTIDHLELTPPAIQVAQRIQLAATARDAAGNIVLTSPSTFTWTSADPTIAVVDTTGIIYGLAARTVLITATDSESGKSVSANVTIQPAVGLVSWWRAEGNPNDAVGGNNGTVFGNVTYVTGVVGQAYSFDGANGTVAIPDASNLKITGSLTIDARIYVKAFPPSGQNYGMILFRGDQRIAYDAYFVGVTPSGTLSFAIQNSDPNTNSGLQPPIATGKWIHVTASLDGNTGLQSVYYDGKLVAQTTTNIRPLGDLDPSQLPGLAIGNSSGYPQGGFNYTFNGYIDEVKVYNQVVAPGL